MSKKKISYNEAIHEIENILNQIENEEPDIDELSENVKKVSGLIKIVITSYSIHYTKLYERAIDVAFNIITSSRQKFTIGIIGIVGVKLSSIDSI